MNLEDRKWLRLDKDHGLFSRNIGKLQALEWNQPFIAGGLVGALKKGIELPGGDINSMTVKMGGHTYGGRLKDVELILKWHNT